MINTVWVARDEDGSLFLYSNKPIKETFEGQIRFVPYEIGCVTMKINSELFPGVTLENSPQQANLTLVKANKNNKNIEI